MVEHHWANCLIMIFFWCSMLYMDHPTLSWQRWLIECKHVDRIQRNQGRSVTTFPKLQTQAEDLNSNHASCGLDTEWTLVADIRRGTCTSGQGGVERWTLLVVDDAACESCLFTLETISKANRVEPNGIEVWTTLLGDDSRMHPP